ncbi:PhzF family phenazine biosynthesis protein [Streptomyces millisiae]|uniref:PhzF family phenazine biosynthesis protein n=1 Tax=Streptomyces millisiae TaxID=3075542 RepID=A0ABU2LRY3_9ACTN|nr:PhzF family phenazine biosynthesis protein [Streptomyces sp. DSM 44918]MDT0320362.1 PhzF family phenazine biosynthesis protein [Streptomyces sp. DSM 44918]
MASHEFVIADVFTERALSGNQLAVFPDARGLSDADMAALTREFGFSETTFVLPPDDPAHTCRVRIFNPAEEMVFAGHPTVGTAAVLAASGRASSGRLVFEEGIGPVPVEVSGSFARFTVTAPYESPEERPDVPAVAAALSLAPREVVEAWFGGLGNRFCYVRLADRATVDRVVVDVAARRAGLAGAWSSDLYVFAGDDRPYARSFPDTPAIPEDPATGSAVTGLVAALAKGGELAVTVEQGVAMGRPSVIEATAHASGAVSIGGHTVVVGQGTISL